MILAIDPGPEQSAFVLFDGERVRHHGIRPTSDVLAEASFRARQDALWITDAIFEGVESYGMAVGAEVFETVFQTGRMFEAACRDYGDGHVHRLFRKQIKLHLCGSVRAKDANIRQALIDRFGGSKAKGTKAQPGPLYGVSSHCWAALAVAVTWHDRATDLHGAPAHTTEAA